MFLPAEIITVLACFRPAFSGRTYANGIELVIGTLLARGRRTVASALRTIGKGNESNWSKYHHVLNRAKWSGLEVSRQLLQLIVATFVPSGDTITIAVDETLERRWGPQIRKCGHWRDSLSSSKRLNVSSRGLRWLVFAVVVQVPWTSYELALPFLSLLLTTPKVSETLGQPHRTTAEVTVRVVRWLRRTLAGFPIHLVGDGAYAVIALGLSCQAHQVVLIAPLRLDARLFEPPYRPLEKGRGRPSLVGAGRARGIIQDRNRGGRPLPRDPGGRAIQRGMTPPSFSSTFSRPEILPVVHVHGDVVVRIDPAQQLEKPRIVGFQVVG